MCMHLGSTGVKMPGRAHCSLVPVRICRLESPATRRWGPKPLTTTGIVEVMAAMSACRPAVVASNVEALDRALLSVRNRCLQLTLTRATRLDGSFKGWLSKRCRYAQGFGGKVGGQHAVGLWSRPVHTTVQRRTRVSTLVHVTASRLW